MVDGVVAGVATLAEDDHVRPVQGGPGDFAGEQVGREVGGLGAEGAEVGSQKNHVVARAEELAAQLVGGPGPTGHRRWPARLDQRIGWMVGPGAELAGDRRCRVGKEVIAGGQPAAGDDTVRRARQIGVDQAVDVGRPLDQPSDGEVGQRQRVVAHGEVG